MKKLILTSIILSTLAGCASLDKWTDFESDQVSKLTADDKKINLVASKNENVTLEESKNFQQEYKNKFINKSITNRSVGNRNEYNSINKIVRGIGQDLIGNLQYVNSTTPIAISSFVFLDHITESTNIIGNQISESFIHEFHKLGIPVIDFKATNYLRVTPTGDFILSRDFLELEGELPIEYVLTGTLVEHKQGYLVNTRMIGLLSKAVVGTAQGFIPKSTVDGIKSKKYYDGIVIK